MRRCPQTTCGIIAAVFAAIVCSVPALLAFVLALPCIVWQLLCDSRHRPPAQVDLAALNAVQRRRFAAYQQHQYEKQKGPVSQVLTGDAAVSARRRIRMGDVEQGGKASPVAQDDRPPAGVGVDPHIVVARSGGTCADAGACGGSCGGERDSCARPHTHLDEQQAVSRVPASSTT